MKILSKNKILSIKNIFKKTNQNQNQNKLLNKCKKKFKCNKIVNKIIIIILFFLCCFLHYINPLNKAKKKKQEEIDSIYWDNYLFNYLKSLKNISYDNISLLTEYRNDILKIFSKNSHKNVTSVDTLYIDYQLKFGNQLVLLNKVIFYCEILKCKKILLEPYNNVYIRNKIIDEQFNLTIDLAKSEIDYKDNISQYYPHPYYFFLEVTPENRFSVFKNEMLRNLPKVKTRKNDLYIHIRGGDVFTDKIIFSTYAQPPFCFYKAIINTNIFNKIYIISEDKINPVMRKLIKRYPNIKYYKKRLEFDISYLAYAYNIVGSISSFLIEIIKLNDNLEKYYEYNIYQLKEKIYHFHPLIYNFKRKYTIYLMEASKNYKENMYFFRRSKKQINIMLRDKCKKEFIKIDPN